MQDAFWGAVSLMILGVLVGLLVLMLVEDARKAMGGTPLRKGTPADLAL